jgi:hypothetical protein
MVLFGGIIEPHQVKPSKIDYMTTFRRNYPVRERIKAKKKIKKK